MTEYIDIATAYVKENPVAILVLCMILMLVIWIIIKQIKFIIYGCILLLVIGGYIFYKHGSMDTKYGAHLPAIDFEKVKEKSDLFREHTKKEILQTLTE